MCASLVLVMRVFAVFRNDSNQYLYTFMWIFSAIKMFMYIVASS